MSGFPRTMVGGLSLSRMIIGTNWFFGWSHTSAAKDKQIKTTMTTDRIAEVIKVFVDTGIDTIMGLLEFPGMKEAIAEAEQRTGKKLIVVSTPTINIGDRPEDMAEAEKTFERNAQLGATFCMPHTCSTDRMIDSRARKIRNMDIYSKMIRRLGMIPGLSTHMPEAVTFADETDLDVATYIQIYNAAGFLMHVEVDWVRRIIWNARHPVMTIKPMAAGRLLPLVGLGFSWATIRDQDMVTVGTMTPDEAKEVIEISLSILERRRDGVELQKTRSKDTVIVKK